MQESSALTKEVSSALHKRSTHAEELSSDQEVSSALHKRSTNAGELSSDQRGQLGQMSSATAHPLKHF